MRTDVYPCGAFEYPVRCDRALREDELTVDLRRKEVRVERAALRVVERFCVLRFLLEPEEADFRL